MRETKWYRNLIIISCAAGIAMFWSFFFLYHTYIQKSIYEERLNQMEEVTHQIFQNLEDVIDARWEQTAEQCSYMEHTPLKTVDELYGIQKTETWGFCVSRSILKTSRSGLTMYPAH